MLDYQTEGATRLGRVHLGKDQSLHVVRSDNGDSPGCSMYDESVARVRCLSMLMLLFKLMPPTIPYVMQLPGAEQ